MQDYTHVYENADKILTHFVINSKQQIKVSDLALLITDATYLHQALGQLYTDGYVSIWGSSDDNDVTITGPGTRLAKNGGYWEEFNRKKISAELKWRVDQSIIDTNNSVEITNKSVVDTNDFTVKNAKKNNNLFWLTLAVAAASTFATVRSCQISSQTNKRETKKLYQDTTIQLLQRKAEQTESVLFRQQNSIDSLRLILDGTKQDSTSTPKKPE
jgi:hypothetical protein